MDFGDFIKEYGGFILASLMVIGLAGLVSADQMAVAWGGGGGATGGDEIIISPYSLYFDFQDGGEAAGTAVVSNDTWIEPLELQTWFVNNLTGGVEIFIILAFIIIAILAARFQFANIVVMVFFVLFAVIMNVFLNFGIIFVLFALMVGLITFYGFSKLWD